MILPLNDFAFTSAFAFRNEFNLALNLVTFEYEFPK